MNKISSERSSHDIEITTQSEYHLNGDNMYGFGDTACGGNCENEGNPGRGFGCGAYRQ